MLTILSHPLYWCQAQFCELRAEFSHRKVKTAGHFAAGFRRVTMNILMSYRRFFRNQ